MPLDESYGISDFFIKAIVNKMGKQLDNKEVDGYAGSGDVQVTISGRHQVSQVRISPRLAHDTGSLEELMTSAINDALNEWKKLIKAELKKIVGNNPLIDEL